MRMQLDDEYYILIHAMSFKSLKLRTDKRFKSSGRSESHKTNRFYVHNVRVSRILQSGVKIMQSRSNRFLF